MKRFTSHSSHLQSDKLQFCSSARHTLTFNNSGCIYFVLMSRAQKNEDDRDMYIDEADLRIVYENSSTVKLPS